MKHLHLAVGIAATLLLSVASGRADADRGTGIGIIVGEPTGLSVKHWLDERGAVDMAAAWSFDDDHERFQLHADYLHHNFHLIPNKSMKLELPVYYGLGGRIQFEEDDEDASAGIRIPIGLDFIFLGTPFDAFIELAPVLDVVPDTDLDLTGGVGLRFFFN